MNVRKVIVLGNEMQINRQGSKDTRRMKNSWKETQLKIGERVLGGLELE